MFSRFILGTPGGTDGYLQSAGEETEAPSDLSKEKVEREPRCSDSGLHSTGAR